MIDYFALGLTHALLLLAVIRMLGRDELDDEELGDPQAPNDGPEGAIPSATPGATSAPNAAPTYRDGRPRQNRAGHPGERGGR